MKRSTRRMGSLLILRMRDGKRVVNSPDILGLRKIATVGVVLFVFSPRHVKGMRYDFGTGIPGERGCGQNCPTEISKAKERAKEDHHATRERF